MNSQDVLLRPIVNDEDDGAGDSDAGLGEEEEEAAPMPEEELEEDLIWAVRKTTSS